MSHRPFARRHLTPYPVGKSPKREPHPARLWLEALEDRLVLSTFIVTTTADSGAGSLRQAIINSNVGSIGNVIDFNIPGAGVQTIALASPLPTITNPVIISGNSQPGFAGTPLIVLDGAGAGAGTNGLLITAGSSTVQDLAIDHFQAAVVGGTGPMGGNGIVLQTGGGNAILGDYLGVDGTGSVPAGNQGDGVLILNSANNQIGLLGGSGSVGNLISGNGGAGVVVEGAPSSGNTIEFNKIGVDATGANALGNQGDGVLILSGAASNTVGGTATLTGGGATTPAGNLIAFNLNGVVVGAAATDTATVGNAILNNSIFSNRSLGIDLGNDGPTPNHPGNTNTGPNRLQDFPVITSALEGPTNITITGTLQSLFNSSFQVQFFSSPTANPSGFGEGETLLGSSTVSTDAAGNGSFSVTFANPQPGAAITATATDPANNTSEFSHFVFAQANSVTALTSTPNPSVFGQPVTFIATVTCASGTTIATGTVTFLEGTTTLGTGNLGSNGQATFTTSALVVGNHVITAAYGGSNALLPSTSSPLTQTVNPGGGLQGAGVPVRAAEGVPLVNVVVAGFLDTRGVQPATNYQATINWGDGSTSAGTVVSTGMPLPASGAFQILASHTYTSESTAIPIAVTVRDTQGTTLVLQATAVVGGFVTQLYHDVLQRVPDPQGLSFWASQVHAGLLNRTQVAAAFWVSAEHRFLEVTQIYQMVLHRAPDPIGQAAWMNVMLSGASEGAVIVAFLMSAEYTGSHSSTFSYVVGLYNDILNRTASAQEIGLWQGALESGNLSRAQVAMFFLGSTEAFVDAINEYYAEFLGRAPDAAGMQTWLTAAQAAQATPLSLVAEVLGSAEYFARALALALA